MPPTISGICTKQFAGDVAYKQKEGYVAREIRHDVAPPVTLFVFELYNTVVKNVAAFVIFLGVMADKSIGT